MDSKSLISIILCNLALNPLNHYLNSYLAFSPFLPQAPTILQLSASHNLEVPADRAILSIHVRAQSTNQISVSGDIRSTQDDLMALLRPHTQLDLNATTSRIEPAISHLGINTLSANSHRTRQTLLGEKPLYEAKAEYSVEFTDLDVLAGVYFKLTRFPRVRVDAIEWKLSDAGREDAMTRCHETAARMLMLKARSTLEPLGLKKLRVIGVAERSPKQRWERYEAMYEDMGYHAQHDELGDDIRLMSVDATGPQFEPKVLGYQLQLEAKIEAS